MVMFSHTAGIVALPMLLELKPHIEIHMAVEGFFIISGYLIFMSYDKSSSLSTYFRKRASRILPAYIFVVLACAFLFSFLSTYSFVDYFFSFDWFKYVLSNLIFANFLHPTLPGVFEDGVINGSLWTIKIEVMFYLTVPLIALLYKKSKIWVVLIVVYTFSALFFMWMSFLYSETLNHTYFIINSQLPGQLSYFIAGGLLYYYKDIFEKNKSLYLVLSLIGLIVANTYTISFIYPIAYAVLVIYFALHFKYLGNFGKYGDLSYGIYIYHYPLAKVFVALGLVEALGYFSYMLLIFTVVVTSYLSWHFIEKPFLRKKSHYKTSEEK